jgi:hypothetical protein
MHLRLTKLFYVLRWHPLGAFCSLMSP